MLFYVVYCVDVAGQVLRILLRWSNLVHATINTLWLWYSVFSAADWVAWGLILQMPPEVRTIFGFLLKNEIKILWYEWDKKKTVLQWIPSCSCSGHLSPLCGPSMSLSPLFHRDLLKRFWQRRNKLWIWVRMHAEPKTPIVCWFAQFYGFYPTRELIADHIYHILSLRDQMNSMVRVT